MKAVVQRRRWRSGARTQLVQRRTWTLDGSIAESEPRPVDDVLTGREEALRRIKPDEAKALMLKGAGLSYAEIGEASDGRTRR